jgi:hypothetical protein
VTGQLSVPNQNPDGPSWAGAAVAGVWLSSPVSRTSAKDVPAPARILFLRDMDTPQDEG